MSSIYVELLRYGDDFVRPNNPAFTMQPNTSLEAFYFGDSGRDLTYSDQGATSNPALAIQTTDVGFDPIRQYYPKAPVQVGLFPISYKVILSSIAFDGRVLRFRNPIEIIYERRDSCHTFEFVPLNMLAYGITKDEALCAFQSEFFLLWDEIACEEDDRLTESALKLKLLLKEIIQEVELEK